MGAVVTRGGQVVAAAHNTRETRKTPPIMPSCLPLTPHAAALGGWRLWQCELFVTLEPCPMCAGAIINSRLKRVVYGASDAKAGCCGSVTDLFSLPFNHAPQVEGGLLEQESAALLAQFFERLRAQRRRGRSRNGKNRSCNGRLPRHWAGHCAGPGRRRLPRGRVLAHM